MSDFTITKEQLRSLTDPKVKEMFPDAFENFDALKRAAIKMGYKKGLYCVFGKDKHIRAIDGNDFKWSEYWDALYIGYDCIFQDGEWAEIVNKNLL
jgi:hypothetical protein